MWQDKCNCHMMFGLMDNELDNCSKCGEWFCRYCVDHTGHGNFRDDWICDNCKPKRESRSNNIKPQSSGSYTHLKLLKL